MGRIFLYAAIFVLILCGLVPIGFGMGWDYIHTSDAKSELLHSEANHNNAQATAVVMSAEAVATEKSVKAAAEATQTILMAKAEATKTAMEANKIYREAEQQKAETQRFRLNTIAIGGVYGAIAAVGLLSSIVGFFVFRQRQPQMYVDMRNTASAVNSYSQRPHVTASLLLMIVSLIPLGLWLFMGFDWLGVMFLVILIVGILFMFWERSRGVATFFLGVPDHFKDL